MYNRLSKTYCGILSAKPYGEISVVKKECIGHVQKRMGTRLRKLVKTQKIGVRVQGNIGKTKKLERANGRVIKKK